jgi:ribonuclease R
VLDFDDQGRQRGVRFEDGVVRSAARLTYTQVERVLATGKRVRGVPPRVMPLLQHADRLRQLLERRRRARGSIDFDMPEPRMLIDVEGAMTGIRVEPRNRGHFMIEEFMLAANVAVASELARRDADCLYRVHEPPEPEKLETLTAFVRGLGFELGSSDGTPAPGDLQRLLDEARDRDEASVIRGVVLRSMKQARYDVDNKGHFGLALPTYTHFTSPIRRYPDLIVHRVLRDLRCGAAGESQRARLAAVAEGCSRLERNAEAAERELLNWKKVAFIAERRGATFDGRVTGVTQFGLFVQLEANLVEGLLRVARLGDEYFRFDAARSVLRGTRTGRCFHLGDRLRVRVEQVDRILQRVDFSWVPS